MGKGAKVQMVISSVVLALVVSVGVWSVGRVGAGREAYYRGVYETCVQSFVQNGDYTQFDVMVCERFEREAREKHWYENALVRP